jgi:signal transduction histidine kinase
MGTDDPEAGPPNSPQSKDTPQERALLERVLDGAPIGILVLDRELRVLRLNTRAAEMFAMDEASNVGQRLQDVLPDVFAEVGSILRDVASGGGPQVAVETSAPTPDEPHHERRYLAYYYPLAAQDGSRVGVGCLFTDISKQRAAEGALRTSESERRVILGQVLEAEDAERSRLAFDLHDDTIQVLFALRVQFDAIIPVAESANQQDIATRMTVARDMLAEVTERTRNLMFELHPTELREHGLKTAITKLAEQVGAVIGAEWSVVVPDARYGQTLEELTFRIVGEALANVRKHSQAGRFSIHLSENDHRIEGVVQDDGRGFVMQRPTSDPVHLGVRGMTERARLAGGGVKITSAPGEGVRVEFHLPIDESTHGWHRRDWPSEGDQFDSGPGI